MYKKIFFILIILNLLVTTIYADTINDTEKKNIENIQNINTLEIGSLGDDTYEIYILWQEYIDKYSEMYNVDKGLISMVIAQESKGNNYAGACPLSCNSYNDENIDSRKMCSSIFNTLGWALGLMQVEDIYYGEEDYWYRTIEFDDEEKNASILIYSKLNNDNEFIIENDERLNPEKNIQFGTAFLAKLLDYYDDDIYKTLFAYNQGQSRANSYINTGDNWIYYSFMSNTGDPEYIKNTLKYYNEDLSEFDINLQEISDLTKPSFSLINTYNQLFNKNINENEVLTTKNLYNSINNIYKKISNKEKDKERIFFKLLENFNYKNNDTVIEYINN